MIFSVPQFIDIEDKIVGPLTAKQLGWLAAGAVILLFCYGLLDQSAFVISAIIVGLIFGSLAFYRPYNQPLINFVMSSVMFATRPKRYLWHRTTEKIQRAVDKPVAMPVIEKKKFDSQKVADISKLLDTRIK